MENSDIVTLLERYLRTLSQQSQLSKVRLSAEEQNNRPGLSGYR